MYPLHSLPGRTASIGDEEWLYFSGTSYLGLARDPAFRDLIERGMDKYGLHYGGSRLATIKLDIFEMAEAHLASLTGAGHAVILSSGTLAGQCVAWLLREEGRSFMAPETHPALWGEAEPMEGSRAAWISKVLENASRWEGGLVLYSNAIDAMRARAFDFSWLSDLPSEVPVTLVVDESHSIGLLGPDGGGSYRALQAYAPQARLVVTGSLGKAFGIPAGFVAGDEEVVEALRKLPFFGGASPPTPAWLHAFVHGEGLYMARRETLRKRIHQWRNACEHLGLFRFLTHFPVAYCEDVRLSGFLEKEKILISSFPYPSPEDPPLQRVVLNAQHTQEDIQRLADAVKGFAEHVGRE